MYNNTIQFTTIYNRIYTLQKDVTAGRLTHKLCKSSLAAGSFLLLEELLDVQDMGTDVRGICVALLFYVVEYGLQVLPGITEGNGNWSRVVVFLITIFNVRICWFWVDELKDGLMGERRRGFQVVVACHVLVAAHGGAFRSCKMLENIGELTIGRLWGWCGGCGARKDAGVLPAVGDGCL